ncbi:MAG: aminotransferase class V-fold PLP-dependent enzyme [Oscillospiraceae bacterium]|nr:aminotransferase class V-fold PLP-dependent enzyme [Oscillospiraceae bacterium]
MIYFDNAATSFPKPKQVAVAAGKAFTKYGANPGRSGHPMSMEAAVKVFETRESLASLFGVENPEEVVLTANCTFAVNFALKGFLRQGDHIIISDLEHNAVRRPVHKLAARGRITYSVAKTFPDIEQTVESFAARIRPNTRAIACTHASNAFGIILPIDAIGRLCRERDLLFLVDAAQTAGVLEIRPYDLGIDFLCLAGHKGLYGPTGTGALITGLGSILDTTVEGGTGSFSDSLEQPTDMPDRMESGTVNMMGILGLGAGIDFVREKTPAAIYVHEMRLATEAFARLRNMPGLTLHTPDFAFGSHVPVIPFNLAGKTSEETIAELGDKGFALRGGLHCAPLAHQKMGTMETGAARISFGAFNTLAETHQLCDAIEQLTVDS